MPGDSARDIFYDEPQSPVHNVSPTQCIFILGNFNVRVGTNYAPWQHQIGHHGVENMNENG